MSEKFEKLIPEKYKRPECKVCGGLHKTSRHAEYVLEKKSRVEPVCEICKGPHQTPQHFRK